MPAEARSSESEVKMLFPKVDVRPTLLSGHDRRFARQISEVEIDLSTARDKSALEQLERGAVAVRRYDVQTARVLLCNASAGARESGDGFVEAAATMLQTIQMDGMTPTQSQPQFLAQALSVLELDLSILEEQFIDSRAKKEVTAPILDPRRALRDLLRENLEQYRLRERSLSLADTRADLDSHLSAGRWVPAENVSRNSIQFVERNFGSTHWWCGVFRTRLAKSLGRQGKADAARVQAERAMTILVDWKPEGVLENLFDGEFELLREAAPSLVS